MESALALIVPSVVATDGDAEGLPSVVPEAMAHGCAVIGTTGGGIAEVVTDGVTGLLVPPGDAASLAAAMHLVSAEPDMAAALAAAAFRMAAEKLNAVRQSGRLETILLEAADLR
jgi:glycosyltransferase involved in cell wall biosynthesis